MHLSVTLLNIILPGQDRHFWDTISKFVFKGHPMQWVPFHIGFYKGQVIHLLAVWSKWVLIGHASQTYFVGFQTKGAIHAKHFRILGLR